MKTPRDIIKKAIMEAEYEYERCIENSGEIFGYFNTKTKRVLK
jgi:hypothetical protein